MKSTDWEVEEERIFVRRVGEVWGDSRFAISSAVVTSFRVSRIHMRSRRIRRRVTGGFGGEV